MVTPGPDPSCSTRFIWVRAHVVHYLVNAHLLSAQYVASQDNAVDALTKGLGATTHRKEGLLLCLTDQDQ
eukprot:7829761-Prorocentrum_lima.AAC.1